MPNEKLEPCEKGNKESYKLLARWEDIWGVSSLLEHVLQPLTQMGEKLSPWNVIYTYLYCLD